VCVRFITVVPPEVAAIVLRQRCVQY